MPIGLKRWQHEGHLHFITFSCYERRPFLNTNHARILFEEQLETLRLRHKFDVHGYVLMPEHVHFLMSEPKIGSVASTLRVLKGETSKKLKGTRDHFWRVAHPCFKGRAGGPLMKPPIWVGGWPTHAPPIWVPHS